MVGGFVRDTLLQRETHDMDFATDVSLSTLTSLFPHSLVFAKFGTLSFRKDGVDITIAHFRKEGDYQDHRHPLKVEFISSYQEDSIRRDFTINALYVSKDFEIHDPTGYGLADCESRILRFIGEPEKRIQEDPLRIIRALRFQEELSLTMEENTRKAIDSSFLLSINCSSLKSSFKFSLPNLPSVQIKNTTFFFNLINFDTVAPAPISMSSG